MFVHFNIYAQNDTIITLNEIEVYGNRFSVFAPGNKTQNLDTTDLTNYRSSALSSLLTSRSGVFIKGYGPGMLATPTLRGSSSSQTALLWNGFNIQSPMNGQNDLSLFPVFFADNIDIQHGGTGSVWGSGAIGGAINLNNNTDFDGKVFIESEAALSSIENYSQFINVRFSSNNISANIRAFNNSANNKFDYYNSFSNDSIIYTQQFSGVQQKGILNEFYVLGKKSSYSVIRLWYQDNERNIPPTLMQNHSGAFQQDEALRITALWQKTIRKTILKSQAAYFNETILYKDSAGIESISNAKTYIQELDWRLFNYKNHNINIGVNNNLVKATSGHYQSELTLNRFAVFSAWKWNNTPETFNLYVNARKEWQQGHNIPLVPSFGLLYKLNSDLSIKGNIGKSFRMPTINDLYWIPGGNPNLLPESGWNQDVSLSYDNILRNQKSENALQLSRIKLSVTGFHRKINNWIIWLPKSGIWTPQNLMEVRSKGLEFENILEVKSDNALLSLKLFYDNISSVNEKQKSPNDASVNKQIIYTPKHIARGLISAYYKNVGLYVENNYTGKRYTSSDNLDWLEPYFMVNTGINYTIKRKHIIITSKIDVINLLNEDFMIVSGNPMPLRYYQFGLNVKFEKQIFN